MDCKICKAKSNKFHSENVLGKYQVGYFKCDTCGFIQTETPYWLQEAYNSAITHLDIGLIQRNLYLKEKIPRIIDMLFPSAKIFVDYGGGYGIFVRMMRDLGFDFYRYDIYCENLFAKHFDSVDASQLHFDILTSFEVFEHLEDPIPEITKMFGMGDSIILSTHLIPDTNEEFKKWWYVAPQTGQHIAFYDKKSFHKIADLLKCNYYTNGIDLHILTRLEFTQEKITEAFAAKEKGFFEKIFTKEIEHKRDSLLQSDFDYIKNLYDNKR